MCICGKKRDPFQGPKLGSCLTLRNELSERDTCADKARDFIGKGCLGGEQYIWKPRRTALPRGFMVFYDEGISFWVVSSQSFWLKVLSGGAHLVQPRWIPERILVGGRTCGVSFWPFSNSSGWWWLISSLFLTRTSCHKTSHANGYYGAWPAWVVSVSVLPLTHIYISIIIIYLSWKIKIY